MKEYEKYMIGRSLIVSAFPGTGKSYYCNIQQEYVPEGFSCDSDSSKFDKSNFPENYIAHIKEQVVKGIGRIMVSSHKDVRDALIVNQLPFVLVYPDISLKHEYINRYIERGNTNSFIELLNANWEKWINECEGQPHCLRIKLNSGQFLGNVL